MKMSTFSGDQIAQVNNPDPFAVPVWRSPVFHTPGWVITIVQLARALDALVAFLGPPPAADLTAALLALAWYLIGWPGPVILAASIATVLATWWWRGPASFPAHVTGRALGKWRRWHYQRHWAAVMTIGRLAPIYQGRLLLPVLGKVTSTPFTDRVLVGIVSGQSAGDFAAPRREPGPRVRRAAVPGPVGPAGVAGAGVRPPRRPGRHHPRPAHPGDGRSRALAGRPPRGRRRCGLVRLHGTHLLVAGATGAGKASIIWGLIRACSHCCKPGWCGCWAPTRSGWNWSYGREIFDTYGQYAADPPASPPCSTQAVKDMQDRAETARREAARPHAHRRVPIRGGPGG